MSHAITIYIDDAHKKRLTQLAKMQGKSVSRMIREQIETFLDKKTPAAPRITPSAPIDELVGMWRDRFPADQNSADIAREWRKSQWQRL